MVVHESVELIATDDEVSVSSVKFVEKVSVVVSLQPKVPPTSGTVTPPEIVLETATLRPTSLENEPFSAVLVPVSYTHLDVYKRQAPSCTLVLKGSHAQII